MFKNTLKTGVLLAGLGGLIVAVAGLLGGGSTTFTGAAGPAGAGPAGAGAVVAEAIADGCERTPAGFAGLWRIAATW